MDAVHKQCVFLFSVETHMFGMGSFWGTNFMPIVYLIRNSNYLVGLINLWKSNRNIVYPHVRLSVYTYEIFTPLQGSLAAPSLLWCDLVCLQVSQHCHHQLVWQEMWKWRERHKEQRREFMQRTEQSVRIWSIFLHIKGSGYSYSVFFLHWTIPWKR